MSEPPRTFDVEWRRPNDPEVLECRDLPTDLLVFRIRAAIRNYGSVELLTVKPSDPGIKEHS
jgi:hypothetical protein